MRVRECESVFQVLNNISGFQLLSDVQTFFFSSRYHRFAVSLAFLFISSLSRCLFLVMLLVQVRVKYICPMVIVINRFPSPQSGDDWEIVEVGRKIMTYRRDRNRATRWMPLS